MPTNREPTCSNCGGPLAGRFCETCGHDSRSAEPVRPARTTPPVPPAPDLPRIRATWSLVATADRTFFDATWAASNPEAGVAFPAYCPERRFDLDGEHVLIGRRNARRGITPHVDLTGPPEDSAVSHSHALLTLEPRGTWVVVDLGSTNGTYLNDSYAAPIAPNTAVPLQDGDRLHVGAWTTLTVRATRA